MVTGGWLDVASVEWWRKGWEGEGDGDGWEEIDWRKRGREGVGVEPR